MYRYHFTQYAGTDRVFSHPSLVSNPGDILRIGTQAYILCLGEDISWKEQSPYTLSVSPEQTEIIIESFLHAQTLAFLHWFVNEWYTTYKNALPLRIHDLEDILKRVSSGKKPKKGTQERIRTVEKSTLLQQDELCSGQQLLVFPDLWTMKQTFIVPPGASDTLCVLHGKSTPKQKSEAFLGIRSGYIRTLACTYSQIFQDREDLKHIVLIDQHKWYYKHQQDPRYAVGTVLERMAKIYDAKIIATGEKL